MKMRVVLVLVLQLVKLFIIGFAEASQGPEGSLIAPSPAFLPDIHPRGEAPSPIHHGQSWGRSASSPSEPDGFVTFPSPATLPVDPAPSEAPRNPERTIAPSSPDVPNGSFLHPPVTLPPPTSAPTPQKIKGIETTISPSHSPSTVTFAPPPTPFPTPSTAERNVSPSIQLSPLQMIAPAVRPPESTPIAPAPFAIHSGNFPKISPASQPIEHGSLPPKVDERNENKTHNLEPISPAPSTTPSGNLPKISPASQPIEHESLPPKVDKRNEHKAHNPEPISPAPFTTPSGNLPKISPAIQPIKHESLPPKVDKRNENKTHNPEPISPAPVTTTPYTNLPKISPVSHPTVNGSLPPIAHREGTNKGQTPEPISPAPVFNLPKHSRASQPTVPGSFPPTVHRTNSSTSHTLEPVSQAPVAIPPAILPINSPVSQPTNNGSFPPNVHNRTANKGHTHTPEPVMPVPVTSPTSPFPVDPPLAHPVIPVASPAKLPEPVMSPALTPSRSFNWKKGGEPTSAPLYKTPKPLPAIVHSAAHEPVISPALNPSRSFNWKKGGEPVSAPLYKTRKPLPAIVHSPAHAPTEHKARQFHHAPKPKTSSPKSPSNEVDHSPSLPPTTYHKRNHSRKTIISPAPASSYLVPPPVSKHQDRPIPPPLPPTSGRRHRAPPPLDTGSSVSPFNFPIQSPVSQVSPAPSPSFKRFPQPTKIPFHPPKVSPSRPSSKSPKKPIPQVQALPPPPPNEDCLSTVCSEPYTNSPPGAPCRCVWPMKVGLRLSVPLYTFFPLVSDLASEIATGVFMSQSQVRIMGANEATQQPDKTDTLIDLVPLGEEFDNTTAFLTSERFWHKKVAIKASYFGDYEVLYVSYPGLPPSPPLPPSSINMIDGGPYSNGGNDGRTIKPLGVDIPKRQHKGGLSKGAIAIIALSAFLAVVLCSSAALAVCKCREHVSQPTSTPPVLPSSLTKTPGTARSIVGGVSASASSSFRSSIAAYTGSAKTFSLNEIEKATDNFHASRIVGEGGFGLVYSGDLEDGTKVAVKVLKRADHHGDREFLSEVEMLSRLHHRNLVKLIGICAEVSSRCLVYELIPNGSVESHLHGDDRERSALDWSTRIKIALGAARGLAYLHEDSSPHVIHRDFKASNILLEDDFTPKVSDFGLARIAADDGNRHISTRVMGTFGYVAPEYAMTGHLLVKSDVYSYGVVLLELLTGRKPIDMSQPPGQENLVAWARPLLASKEGLDLLIDPSLGPDVPYDSVAKVAAIASMCVQPEVSDRPFMGEVVQALKLVCNECDEAKEAGSRSTSREDLSVDLNTVSGQHLDDFQGHFSDTNHDSDVERGLSASELFSSSARLGRQASGSFRLHSYSGPLRTGRSQRLWQIIRKLSGGSVSEHGTMFKL